MAINEEFRPSAGKWAAGLSDSHRVLVEEYLVDLNVAKAAERAGYTREAAYRALRRADVAHAIDLALAERPGITRARIIEELARIAFANMGDYVEVSGGHVVVADHKELTAEQLSVISEIGETVTEHGGSIRVKLHDKLGALEKLGKVLRMFVERQEISGPDGKPIEVEDARSRVMGRLNKLRDRMNEAPAAEPAAEGNGG